MNNTTRIRKVFGILAGISWLLFAVVEMDCLIYPNYYGRIFNLLVAITSIYIAVMFFCCRVNVATVVAFCLKGGASLIHVLLGIQNISYDEYIRTITIHYLLACSAFVFMAVLSLKYCKRKESGFLKLWFLPIILCVVSVFPLFSWRYAVGSIVMFITSIPTTLSCLAIKFRPTQESYSTPRVNHQPPLEIPVDRTTYYVCNDATQEIRNYKKLLDDGIISQQEFEAKKRQLMGL